MRKLDPEWVIVGSSAGAPEWLPAVLAATKNPVVMTTNSGRLLFESDRRPDIYFLGGEVIGNLGIFAPHIAAAKEFQKAGTWTVGLKRDPEDLVVNDMDWLDQYLEVDYGEWGQWRFHRGHYGAVGISGLFCLQYAVNNEAKHIHCIGMEGYAGKNDYFDGSPDSQAEFTDIIIQPFTQALVSGCPDVSFSFYGNLLYEVTAPNVQIHKDQKQWKSSFSNAGEDSGPNKLPTSPTVPQIC